MEHKILKRSRIVSMIFIPLIITLLGIFLTLSPIIFWGSRSDVISLFKPGVIEKVIYDIERELAADGVVYYLCMVASLLVGISMIFVVKRTSYNIVLDDDKMHGKIGYKKISVCYADITNLSQRGKSLMIRAKGKKIKISAVKNYDEIYDFMKPRMDMTVFNNDNTISKIGNVVEHISKVFDKENTESDDIKLF